MQARRFHSVLVLALVLPAPCSCGPSTPAPDLQPVPVASLPAPVPAAPASAPAPASSSMPADAEVLAVCEAYRRALLARDVDALLRLASPAYHDDGGTPDPSDDLDYAGLQAYLQTSWGKVTSIELEMRPGRPIPHGARVRVPVQLAARFELGGKWMSRSDTMELVLEPRDGKLLIVSGM